MSLKKVIKALTVFEKYSKGDFPFRLSSDAIIIREVGKDVLTSQEREIVISAGFEWNDDFKAWSINECIT